MNQKIKNDAAEPAECEMEFDHNGEKRTMEFHQATIDNEAAAIANTIVDFVLVVHWETSAKCETMPYYHGWTADDAEVAICSAAKRIPELCDQLQALEGPVSVPDPEVERRQQGLDSAGLKVLQVKQHAYSRRSVDSRVTVLDALMVQAAKLEAATETETPPAATDPFEEMHDNMKAKHATDNDIATAWFKSRSGEDQNRLLTQHGDKTVVLRSLGKKCKNLRAKRKQE